MVVESVFEFEYRLCRWNTNPAVFNGRTLSIAVYALDIGASDRIPAIAEIGNRGFVVVGLDMILAVLSIDI